MDGAGTGPNVPPRAGVSRKTSALAGDRDFFVEPLSFHAGIFAPPGKAGGVGKDGNPVGW
jgi:hypothetical protein